MINKKRQFFRKNRKGELTTKQLVTIIILITSFVIVLFLFFRLNIGETSNKEICHNSVVLRGQSAFTSGPLDCRTSYICVSGGGSCKNIPTTTTVEVDSEKKEDIMKALAEEMSSCWWQFGEGKIDYVGADSFQSLSCSLCSIVEFDETIAEISISHTEFYNYLKNNKKEGSQSYLNYLYNTNSLDVFDQNFIPEDYLTNSIEPDKTYFILTGEAKEGILSPRWKFWETKFTPYPVVILERTSENYAKLGCDEFIIKA